MKRECTHCGQPIAHLRPDSTKSVHSYCHETNTELIDVLNPESKIIEVPIPEKIEGWLLWRMRGIGGSDAPAIMNASPWCTRDELWARKTNRMAPPELTYPMQRGIELESKARDLYQIITGDAMPKKLFQRTDITFARASLDGINVLKQKALEIKCPGAEDHLLALEGKIPDKYVWQCVHLCWVTGLEKLDYFSYNPRANFDGPKIATVPFTRNLELEAELIREETKFWECVVKDERPESPKVSVQNTLRGNVFTIRKSR